MTRRGRFSLLFVSVFFLAAKLDAQAPVAVPRAESETTSGTLPPRASWVYFDAPIWDFADEGLPFRLTLALPSRRDPLARLLWAETARWTLSAGYAKVYNSYDGATGVFKNPGAHTALFSAGRQYHWRLPRLAGKFTPKLTIEFGVNYALHRFPADGTRASFKAIPGLEWTWRARDVGARADRTRDASAHHAGSDAPEWSLAVVWPHFSNANVFSRNAGYDALALRIGRSVRF